MPGRAKLTDEQVKRIRRRVRAGERLTDLAPEYDVNRKTIRRRLDAAARADAERARRTAAKRAEQKRMQRLYRRDRDPAARPEHARSRAAERAAPAGRRRTADGRILRPARPYSYADLLDEHDAPPAPPDPPVKLVSENGQSVGSTAASNAERMAAALAPHYGPLTIVPA